METYINSKEYNLYFNKYITSFVINLFNNEYNTGPEYGEHFYLDKEQIERLIRHLKLCKDIYLERPIDDLERLIAVMRKSELVDFYFN